MELVPAVESVPEVEFVPAVESVPAVELVPAVLSVPAVEFVPAVESTPAVELVPEVESVPAVTPAEDEVLGEELLFFLSLGVTLHAVEKIKRPIKSIFISLFPCLRFISFITG